VIVVSLQLFLILLITFKYPSQANSCRSVRFVSCFTYPKTQIELGV